jgi:hypothetical protein
MPFIIHLYGRSILPLILETTGSLSGLSSKPHAKSRIDRRDGRKKKLKQFRIAMGITEMELTGYQFCA